MTNSELLKKSIKESGLKLAYIAEKLGISRCNLYQKINNKALFDQHEILILCEILRIETLELKEAIFFAQM